MEELEWLENELIEAYVGYAEEAKKIWTENDAIVADEMVQKLYRQYKSKQINLDRLISMQKSIVEDIETYKSKHKKETIKGLTDN